jgi:C-1 hydroxylase
MSHEPNKAIIRRFIDTWNSGDLEALSDFFAPDVVHHARSQKHGRESIKQINRAFHQAFPDLRYTIEDMVAEGDIVVTRLTARATHAGRFLDAAPTSRTIECALIEIARLRNGEIVEHWGLADELHLMEQVGLVPTGLLAAMS